MKYLLFHAIVFIMSLNVGAQASAVDEINKLMDAWHQAAATADEDVFFNQVMDSASIYIGTDAGELWTGRELEEWSRVYFQSDTAWSFTPLSRNVYLSKDYRVAWFDELLDTWMGTCRGSGVLEKEGQRWRLRHYHLAIAIPNDKVNEYLQIIKKK